MRVTSHTSMVLGILLAVLASGCGSSAPANLSSGRTVDGGASSSTSSGEEPASQFRNPQGQNQFIVEFGHEASAKERQAASAVLRRNLKARETGDWVIQCATLDRKTVIDITEGKPAITCPALLQKGSQPLASTEKARADTLTGSITALRVEGRHGWALYHGNDGEDWAMAMEREGTTWKVGALLTTELG